MFFPTLIPISLKKREARKPMKKVMITLLESFIILTIMIGLGGCDTESKFEPYSMDYQFGYDHQRYLDSLSGIGINFAQSKDGYYLSNGNYLYYMDKSSLSPTILCNKPNCLHNAETDEQKKRDCTAYVPGGIRGLQYYGDNLYYLEEVIEESGSSYTALKKAALDGTYLEELYRFYQHPQALVFHRGYFYVSYPNYEEESDGLTASSFELIQIDINNKNEKILYTNELQSPIIDQVNAYGKYLYFHVNGYQVSGEQYDPATGAGMVSKLICYDLENDHYTEVETIDGATTGYLAITEDSLVFSCWHFDYNDQRNRIIYQTDLDGSNLREFMTVEPTTCNIMWDGTYYYVDNSPLVTNAQREDITRTVWVYDANKTLVSTFDFTNVDGVDMSEGMVLPLKMSDDYIFAVDFGSDFNANSFVYIDKSELKDGNISPHKVTF